ncbi:RagB/SusD family nutrient uptake outer membrane protein [Flavobacterium sp. HJSW_4]|uniref:RagB/SusD family nutrient uptake outer membrane protein n=1 Tax=Flavobacterium sp. HJSW_4 TaxID=3344660 RepID=UPI0035F46169
MKTTYYIFKFILFVSLMIAVISCDSFVEVELPKSQLTSTGVFNDYATADAALTNIYASIRDKGILSGSGYGISNQLGNYADELTSTQNPNNTSLVFYNNSLLATNTSIAEYWNTAYNQIYAANAILEGIEKSSSLNDEQKKYLKGQSLFIRSLLHFYIVNLFGDIPYITKTDFRVNKAVSRTPKKEVYQFIINDLLKALDFLPVSYNDSQRVRPNKSVATALLARVYLYDQSYSKAEEFSSAILNLTQFYHLEDISSVFLINSKETIWQLHAGEAGKNTLEAAFFSFSSGPPPQVSLNNSLINSFEKNDLRKKNWTKEITNGTSFWYHAFKYKEKNTTSTSKEFSIIMRLSEQFLIRAEARAFLGDLDGATDDLNKIRQRAGINILDTSTQQEILDAIQNERRSELFTEQGHRFFDLKRFGKLDVTLSNIKPGWDSTDSLFPIPQTELNTNPNLLPQNSGY